MSRAYGTSAIRRIDRDVLTVEREVEASERYWLAALRGGAQ
jgi:hypothetical protein